MKKIPHIIILLGLLTIVLVLQPKAYAEETQESIENRIKPLGSVTVGAAAPQQVHATAAAARTGDEIYSQKCSVCHTAGVAGAPIRGDKSAWEKRGGKGQIDKLVKNAIAGLNAMPPRGTCMDCSDDEIKAAVLYMLQ